MIFTVKLTVTVSTATEKLAYRIIRHALNNARLGEIVIVDQEVIGKEAEEDEPELPLE
jgi:hypothetical protein